MTVSTSPVERIYADPSDPTAHALLGDGYAAQQSWQRAIAQYRTALALADPAADPTALMDLVRRIAACAEAEAAVRPAQAQSHNMYFRTDWLGRRLRELYRSGVFSLLDAGGGDGRLCLEVPDADYVLAEPATNGLFVGEHLDFGRTFDCIVCCHVVEHIPIEDRDAFLDVLCSKATDRVLLLNPVADEHTDIRAWQQLIFDVTGANWAREHIDCDMPTLDDLTSYCERRGLRYAVRPNGSKPLSLAIVFLDHYARTGRPQDVARINQMFNALAHESLDDPRWPNAWLVEIEVGARR